MECRTCGAPMIWVTTQKGKKMPLDAEPVAKGKFLLNDDMTVAYIPESDPYTGERYSSHFETCPDAAAHSKKGTP